MEKGDLIAVSTGKKEDQNDASEKEEKNPEDIARQKRQFVLFYFEIYLILKFE